MITDGQIDSHWSLITDSLVYLPWGHLYYRDWGKRMFVCASFANLGQRYEQKESQGLGLG